MSAPLRRRSSLADGGTYTDVTDPNYGKARTAGGVDMYQVAGADQGTYTDVTDPNYGRPRARTAGDVDMYQVADERGSRRGRGSDEPDYHEPATLGRRPGGKGGLATEVDMYQVPPGGRRGDGEGGYFAVDTVAESEYMAVEDARATAQAKAAAKALTAAAAAAAGGAAESNYMDVVDNAGAVLEALHLFSEEEDSNYMELSDDQRHARALALAALIAQVSSFILL